MNPNTLQDRAVNETGNLIVSAAAGAGKTTVLTRRVLRLIEEGMGIDEMLILTFTRAAAAHMKSVIEKKLTAAEQAETDPVKKRRLQRQLLLCPNASISTIDSFCSAVVHRHYYRVDLAPGMGVISNTEQAVLFDEATVAAEQEMATGTPEQFQMLVRAFNGEANVKDAVGRLHSFLCAQPDREAWLARIEADCRGGRLTEAAEEKLFERCRGEMKAAAEAFHKVRYSLPDYAEAYKPYADAVLPALRGLELAETLQEYVQKLEGIAFPARLPVIHADVDILNIKPAFVQCRDTVKNSITEQLKLFSAEPGAETENRQVTRIVEALLALLRRTEELFSAAKLEKGKLDFGDMEYYAVKLLAIPEVAQEYRNRFKTVIVDEYQDSNRLQEAILDSIRRPGGLFLVGDVKQSIYGFRMAVPDLFTQKVKRYSRGEDGQCIDLNCNFRSSDAILDAVNGVFSQLMTAETGLIEYDETQKLNPGMDQPKGEAELVLIDCVQPEDADPEEELENPEAEAMFCVETIRRIMAEELYQDRNSEVKPRPYTYRDFAVLLRNSAAAQKMAKIFTEEGIPCFAESGSGYFDSIEVQLFLNVLRIIDNRRQDIPLLSVMRSLIGDFSDEELIALRKQCPKDGYDILDCLLAGAEKAPDGKADRFLKRIEDWRKKSLYLPTRELCSLLLDETGLLREMSMLPGGRQREANLNAVLDIANEYDGSGAFGLHGFLRFMDKAQEKDKIGSAPTVTGNVVQFMTVHKSKGLEFPVVFYCDLARRFNRSDAKQDMLLHSELGISLRYTDERHVKHEPRLHRLLARCIASAACEEEMRVMYVGMTRAERKLYMVGSVKDLDKTLEKLPACVSAAEIRGALDPLKWLMLLSGSGALDKVLPRHIVEKGVLNRTEPEKPALPAPDPEKLRALARRLERVYPWPAPAGVPNKTSATALSGTEKVFEFREDPFGKETEEETPRALALQHGTEIHALLEKMPLGADRAEARLERLRTLSPEDRASVEWFLSSELFARMQASPLCRRELPFTAAVDSGSLPGLGKGEQVLLQGVIDCCFLENGGYTVLDYKTDRFRGRTAEEQAETHREQVELYARVLQDLTGKPVKEQYVVFINERVIVKL